MAGLAQINIKFSADLAQFSSEIQNSARQLKKMGGELQTLGAGLTVGLTAPILAFGVASVNAFDESAKAIAQVDAALKSTGGTVGFNSEQLQKMAADLQKVTTFDDDKILKEATANLLTFNKVTGETFVQAQKAALDLATRLDGDLQTATLQIGKALQDPIKGITALSKAGVSFSADQKATIKAMVATNNVAGAQSIILKELNKEFGGSAEAAAKAGTGSFKQLANQVGDLSEEFGKIIVDALQPFIEGLKGMVSSFQALSPETKKVIAVIAGVVAILGPAILAFGTIVTLVPTFVAGLTAISGAFTALTAVIASNPIGAIAVVLGLAVAAFVSFNSETKKAVVQQSNLNELNNEAIALAAKQQANLNSLVAVAKNETLSKKERVAAIKEINKISPEYLGNLNLENIATDKARLAIEKYNIALLAGAKARIAQQKIQEITNKQAQQEIDAIVNAGDVAKATAELKKRGIEDEGNVIEKLGNKYKAKQDAEKKQYQEIYDANKKYLKLVKEVIDAQTTGADAVKGYKVGSIAYFESLIAAAQKEQKEVSLTGKEFDALQVKIDAYQKKIDAISKSTIKLPKPSLPTEDVTVAPSFSLEDLRTQQTYFETLRDRFATTSDEYKAYADQINAIEIKIKDIVGVDEVKSQLDGISAKAEEIKNNVYSSLVEGLGSAFSSFADGIVANMGFAQDALGRFASALSQTVIKLLSMYLAQSIAASISGATASGAATGPAAIFTTPAFIATAIAGVIAAFAAIPRFETGGIVGGSSFYGDKIMARVNSGELILNKRQQNSLYGQLNQSSVQPIVLGAGWEISGDTIRLVLDRNDKKKNRLG